MKNRTKIWNELNIQRLYKEFDNHHIFVLLFIYLLPEKRCFNDKIWPKNKKYCVVLMAFLIIYSISFTCFSILCLVLNNQQHSDVFDNMVNTKCTKYLNQPKLIPEVLKKDNLSCTTRFFVHMFRIIVYQCFRADKI